MLFLPVIVWVASIAARVSADTEVDQVPQQNAAVKVLLSQKPMQGVRKMSDDEGEKFFMDYWHFEEDIIAANSTEAEGKEEYTEISQSTLLPRSYHFLPPFSVGFERFANPRLSVLVRRDFQCPADTYACTSINRPDSCCRTDESCVPVENTGFGDVGCCPVGQDCSGAIGSCWEGYTSCSSSLGGGCCIPGYECVSEGCARVVTVTITTHSTTLTTTSTETIPATTTISTTPTTTGSSSSRSSTTTSTGDLAPPDRPTSLSTTTSSSTESLCPTGFYACSAVYHGGCCRTGRDCDTTSCPAIPSTTIVSDEVTIVVPEATTSAGSSEGGNTGRCANGWFSCANTVGGGCCPSGYACGSSCTAVLTASTTETVAKAAPTASTGRETVRSNLEMLICSTIGIVWMML